MVNCCFTPRLKVVASWEAHKKHKNVRRKGDLEYEKSKANSKN